VGKIIDVFGSTGEVHKLETLDKLWILRVTDKLLNEIFDSLHVMVRAGLQMLDLLSLSDREVFEPGPELSNLWGFQSSELRKLGVSREKYEPLYLDGDPEPDKAVFAYNGSQRASFIPISAVKR
jgi:hypothetical protein